MCRVRCFALYGQFLSKTFDSIGSLLHLPRLGRSLDLGEIPIEDGFYYSVYMFNALK